MMPPRDLEVLVAAEHAHLSWKAPEINQGTVQSGYKDSVHGVVVI